MHPVLDFIVIMLIVVAFLLVNHHINELQIRLDKCCPSTVEAVTTDVQH